MTFFTLAPGWIMFDEFWRSLKRRNRWLIILRYWASGMLMALTLTVTYIPGLDIETLHVAMVAAGILGYNLALHRALPSLPEQHARFNGLHFALIQISADLCALLAVVYFTGGVESPFLPFFIFHVIIGSLILPAAVVSIVIGLALSLMAVGATLELSGAVPHHPITGLLAQPLYTNGTFVLVTFLIFAVTLFISNFLANSISKELYLRERSLTEAYTQLEEAEVAKSRYVMSVVHDLKTPIAAATTYLNMVLERTFGELNDDLAHALERSRARLHGAITTINDILQLSQLKLSRDLTRIDVNLTALVDEVWQEMRILYAAKDIRFSTWTNASSDIHLDAEPTLLRLALGNLLSNACKYTEPGGRVEVHLKRQGEHIMIEVADDGIGVPVEEQEKIFRDFYRAAAVKKRGDEGTGLGLSVVLHIIEQLGGSVSVESPSRLGDGGARPGAAFIVTLPDRESSISSATRS